MSKLDRQTMSACCHIGTSGWVYPHWRGIFYPPKLPQRRWFNHYVSKSKQKFVEGYFPDLPASAQQISVDERWFVELVRDLLIQHNLVFSIFDLPGVRYPQWVTGPVVYFSIFDLPGVRYPQWVTGPVVYLRFHGAGARDAGGHAVSNARQLRALVDANLGLSQ